MPPHLEPALTQDFDGLLLRPVHAVAIRETRISLPVLRSFAEHSKYSSASVTFWSPLISRAISAVSIPGSFLSRSYRALIIATYHAINVVNYIPTYLLHKVAPAGNMGHRGLPLSLPSLFVTHADQSPYPLHRHPRNRHPFLLSPRLAFHPPMRKGAAPKRDPFRAGISLQFVTHPSLIRSGLLQAWPRTSWRHHSFPPHRRSYPRCRIGGIRLRQASRAAPRGAASRCSRRRTARFGCRGR